MENEKQPQQILGLLVNISREELLMLIDRSIFSINRTVRVIQESEGSSGEERAALCLTCTSFMDNMEKTANKEGRQCVKLVDIIGLTYLYSKLQGDYKKSRGFSEDTLLSEVEV